MFYATIFNQSFALCLAVIFALYFTCILASILIFVYFYVTGVILVPFIQYSFNIFSIQSYKLSEFNP